MDREGLGKLWEEALTEGLWYAPRQKALDGLTPQQAAWKPRPRRHSIWQLVNHIVFWQDYTLRAARGEKPAREDFALETERRNWEEPTEISDATERPLYHLMHESYHFGQIMYLRAMQGIEPIE